MAKKWGGKTRPTQADVARVANVSQAMVSYILNDNTTLTVPDETRARILAAIDDLGYVPNRRAQSLRTGKTYTLAVIIPDITNPFYPAFERGVQDAAEQRGYDLVTYNTDGVAEKEITCLRSLQQGRVDGVVGVFFHATTEHLRPLTDQGVAVVRFEPRARGPLDVAVDSIYVDNSAAARTAVSYLIERGHTRIGMIAGRQGPRSTRVLGYRQALTDHNIPIKDDLIHDGDFAEGGGYAGMRGLLTLTPRPTAVFAANDLMAMGALIALREEGLRVPQDMAVVGFDDIPAAKLVAPPLTTVTQFERDIGRRAAEMVLERLHEAITGVARSEEMPYRLVLRESA